MTAVRPIAAYRWLDEAELRSRRGFFEITDADLARLAALEPHAGRWATAAVDGLYRLLLSHPETKRFFADDDVVQRVKQSQRVYVLRLFAGRCDLAYAEERIRVGQEHERIGLPAKWYVGTYRRYLHLLHDEMFRELSNDEARAAYGSLLKLMYFDEALALDAYFAAARETLTRHEEAIRELSTPVTRVYEGILLLPIVGALDSRRAQEVTETALARVAGEHARALIIDVAGVPVVDTRVARSLLSTARAVELLGATSVLTGIGPHVARTLVLLGADLRAFHTTNTLADGVQHALGLLGRSIEARAATSTREGER